MLQGKWSYSLAAIAAALTLGACSGEKSAPAASGASAASTAAAGKAYVVATDATYAPFEYEENGQIVGFTREVLDAIAAKQNIKLQFKNTPWEGIFATLNTGDADIVASSVTITDERKQSMDFSEPYFEATQMIVTGAKGSSIKSFADLKGHLVSVQTGTTGDEVVQKLLGKESSSIKRFESMPLALKELLNGGVDASVGDNGVVQNFVNNNPDAKLHTMVDPAFEKEFYGFAVKKGRNDELLKTLNDGIAAIKADGEYDKIYAKYFSGSKDAAAASTASAASN
ncbi:basic amino acid ABC transporter substrate-binding protein [Snodgrassella sp. CFCC 13594]|uniref:basic amino acid ABC transporter substrate-binding protein n=1 Tax=Snodgrassella sp. CFCC 13594 TaxID=1775559 RepID=UPI00082B25AB|nr:basic amino acid ABC transporter substrate-binding protein [Snodgrassella sp. CFCC 13594]